MLTLLRKIAKNSTFLEFFTFQIEEKTESLTEKELDKHQKKDLHENLLDRREIQRRTSPFEA